MDVAYSRKNTDITDKIKMITTKLLEKINDSEYIFDNEDRKINLKNVIQINIRGEIVLNNKDKTSRLLQHMWQEKLMEEKRFGKMPLKI
ncbi:hypothetical protein SDC9_205762 [bioreactor metagenome]|uniref:Uncharacterized protein n=1 Tax=bioreactor metagenome TaxID=1076179 RepID=A0A645JCD8_9ZZZZ